MCGPVHDPLHDPVRTPGTPDLTAGISTGQLHGRVRCGYGRSRAVWRSNTLPGGLDIALFDYQEA